MTVLPEKWPDSLQADDSDGDSSAVVASWLPGPLVRKMLVVACLAIVLAGAVAAALVSYLAGQDSMQRLVSQQDDEVELVARLLASKIEQSQKVLATAAEDVSPQILQEVAPSQHLLQQMLPTLRFFDAMQVARKDGTLVANLRLGEVDKPSNLDPPERDYLLRTLVEGKPLVSSLIGARRDDARIMFTMPLLHGQGRVIGAIAGVMRLQSQGLLPHSLALPARSDSRLIVLTQEGVILSHPQRERVLGSVRDEPGLAALFARWQQDGGLSAQRHSSEQDGYVVSASPVAMPQWLVVRISDAQSMRAPLLGGARRVGAVVGAAIALVMACAALLMLWLARPLALLRRQALALLEQQAREQGAAGMHERADLGVDAGHWPHAQGEVDDVVRACRQLIARRLVSQHNWDMVVRQLRAVLEHAPMGIVLTRGDHVEIVSQQGCRMLGYTTRELQQLPLQALFAPPEGGGDSRATFEQVHQAFSVHGAFEGEFPLLRKDGTTLWVRAQGRTTNPHEHVTRGTVWVLEDCTAAREARQQTHWEHNHDALTQLLNRGAFEQRLQRLLDERAQRVGNGAGDAGAGVLLFLDMDYLTVINDLAGHAAGDDALRYLARLIESEVRQQGWAARLGGDEFAVLLPGCTLERGRAMAEQLRAAIAAWEPAYQGRSFTVGVSIGVVAVDARQGRVATLLHQADMACYAAKRAGRNQVVVLPAGQAATASATAAVASK